MHAQFLSHAPSSKNTSRPLPPLVALIVLVLILLAALAWVAGWKADAPPTWANSQNPNATQNQLLPMVASEQSATKTEAMTGIFYTLVPMGGVLQVQCSPGSEAHISTPTADFTEITCEAAALPTPTPTPGKNTR